MLARPTITLHEGADLATLDDARAAFERAARALSPATRRAYQTELRQWEEWCSTNRLDPQALTPAQVVTYLEHRAKTCAPLSVRRTCASLSAIARLRGLEPPSSSPIVRAWFRAFYAESRTGRTPIRQAPSLERSALLAMLDVQPEATKRGWNALALERIATRDRAVVLVGLLGALRRSEIAALDIVDVVEETEGLRIHVRHSKANREGKPDYRHLKRRDDPRVCPVVVLRAWLDVRAAESANDPHAAFVGVLPNGKLDGRIRSETVGTIVKSCAKRAGYKATGHSLRASFATQASKLGYSDREIAEAGGWQNPRTVDTYIRRVKSWTRNPSEALL